VLLVPPKPPVGLGQRPERLRVWEPQLELELTGSLATLALQIAPLETSGVPPEHLVGRGQKPERPRVWGRPLERELRGPLATWVLQRAEQAAVREMLVLLLLEGAGLEVGDLGLEIGDLGLVAEDLGVLDQAVVGPEPDLAADLEAFAVPQLNPVEEEGDGLDRRQVPA